MVTIVAVFSLVTSSYTGDVLKKTLFSVLGRVKLGSWDKVTTLWYPNLLRDHRTLGLD